MGLRSIASADHRQDALSPLRVAARATGAVAIFLVCAPLHVATKTVAGRSGWPSRFLRAITWVFGIRPQISGRRAQRHTLLLPNHVSWLDILILSGTTGCAFVSKDALGHPLVHWLADQNGTIYVKRTHVKGAKDQAIALAAALEGENPVAVFPEGTVGPGTHLLPFRSTLIEAANYAARDVEVRPVVLDYGQAAPAIAWYQEPVLGNVRRVLGRRGTLPVNVRLLDPLDRALDRKAMSAAARRAIADSLGFADAEPSPIGAAQ